MSSGCLFFFFFNGYCDVRVTTVYLCLFLPFKCANFRNKGTPNVAETLSARLLLLETSRMMMAVRRKKKSVNDDAENIYTSSINKSNNKIIMNYI